jgi:hypothetical protein
MQLAALVKKHDLFLFLMKYIENSPMMATFIIHECSRTRRARYYD